MSDYVDGIHVSEFLGDSLEPLDPSPGGDKKRAANPYLSNHGSRKKAAPGAAAGTVTPAANGAGKHGTDVLDGEDDDSVVGDVNCCAVTPGDSTPTVARASRPIAVAASHPTNSSRPLSRVARAVLQSPERTVAALAGPQVAVNGNGNNDALVNADHHGNQITVSAILPNDWKLTVEGLKPNDKFGKFIVSVVRKAEAWCKGLETLELVTTSYASRALATLDDDDDVDTLEVFGMEGVSLQFTPSMSPLLKRVMGESLSYMGITSPMQSTDLFNYSDDNQVIMTNKAVDLVGYVFPRTGQEPAVFNKAGQSLNHPAFWDNHMDWKQKPNGGKTCFMQLCFTTPLAFLPEGDRADHMAGLQALSNNPLSPVVKKNYFEMCLYDDVARAFKNLMMSPICKKGYKYGWFPVIAVKNALLQRTSYAVNGWRLASCNLHQKSFLSVVGFVKIYSNTDIENIGLLGFNVNGKPITHKEAKGAIEQSA